MCSAGAGQWRVLPDGSAKRGLAVSVPHLDVDNHQAGVALCSAPVCGGGAGTGSRQQEGQLRHLPRQEKARACRLTEPCCDHYSQTITTICITSQSVSQVVAIIPSSQEHWWRGAAVRAGGEVRAAWHPQPTAACIPVCACVAKSWCVITYINKYQ